MQFDTKDLRNLKNQKINYEIIKCLIIFEIKIIDQLYIPVNNNINKKIHIIFQNLIQSVSFINFENLKIFLTKMRNNYLQKYLLSIQNNKINQNHQEILSYIDIKLTNFEKNIDGEVINALDLNLIKILSFNEMKMPNSYFKTNKTIYKLLNEFNTNKKFYFKKSVKQFHKPIFKFFEEHGLNFLNSNSHNYQIIQKI